MANPPRGFDRFLRRGAKLLKNPLLLKRMLTQAVAKLGRAEGGPLAEVKEHLLRLVALLKAYVSGEYRDVSPQTMIVVAAGLAYFVVPMDAVPDFLFGWGLVDDAAVISYVAAQVAQELAAFARWQQTQSSAESDDGFAEDNDNQDGSASESPDNDPPSNTRCSETNVTHDSTHDSTQDDSTDDDDTPRS
jgi:uncharacterized membrane protein YkvA (DUF1232 family)